MGIFHAVLLRFLGNQSRGDGEFPACAHADRRDCEDLHGSFPSHRWSTPKGRRVSLNLLDFRAVHLFFFCCEPCLLKVSDSNFRQNSPKFWLPFLTFATRSVRQAFFEVLRANLRVSSTINRRRYEICYS